MSSSPAFSVEELELKGVLRIYPSLHSDSRGWSANLYDAKAFQSLGIATPFVQEYTAYSQKNVIRGLHYQMEPRGQDKLIRCSQGSIADVVLDIMPNSPTYGQHLQIRLDAISGHLLFIPRGYAHGYCVLEGPATVEYKFGGIYEPEASRGIRYDDPEFSIPWPVRNPILSSQDASWAPFKP